MGEALKSKSGWLGVLGGALLALALWYGLPAFLARREVVGVTVESSRVDLVDADKPAIALEVKGTALLSQWCRRLTTHSLVDLGARRIYPLQPINSGAGFTPPWRGDFDIVLSIPPSIPAGDYKLTIRSVYDCAWPTPSEIDDGEAQQRTSFHFNILKWQIIHQSRVVDVRIP